MKTVERLLLGIPVALLALLVSLAAGALCVLVVLAMNFAEYAARVYHRLYRRLTLRAAHRPLRTTVDPNGH